MLWWIPRGERTLSFPLTRTVGRASIARRRTLWWIVLELQSHSPPTFVDEENYGMR